MKICEYGCGQEAKHQLKNGKWCCSKSYNSCPIYRNKKSMQTKEAWKDPNSGFNSVLFREKKSNIMKKIWNDPVLKEKQSKRMKEEWQDPNSIYNSDLYKEKLSNKTKEAWKDPNSEYNSISFRKKMSDNIKKSHTDLNSGFNSPLNKSKVTIKKINEKYPFFSKIEEMRYNPDKPEEKEIQVHCKNHECENSKEKSGWFTPNKSQLKERIRQIENEDGNGGSYFYCSDYCKDTCSLYNVYGDPYRNTNKPYTSAELKVFNKHILKRDNEICYYCKKHHATIVHHLRPQKLEPFFALDPDYAISVCEKCHYEKGHPTGSEHSTGNLAKIVCSVESQKFLEQKINI